MRQAGQALWNFYKNNAPVQDAAETLLGAGLSAGYQAAFTDMSAEEIAVSTALGAAGAFALRPAMGHIGYAVGKPMDKAFPGAKNIDPGMAMFVSPGSPQAVKAYKSMEKGPMQEAGLGFAQAKYNQNFKKKDGSERGFLEGTIGTWGRQYGDNVAQLGVAVATPVVLQQLRGEDGRLKEIAKLEKALAELRGELPSAITQ